MRKGERTRQRILERAAPVFNQHGYAGASMSELVTATGVEKGGIYNHFGSKEALAVAAFDYAVSLIVDRFAQATAGKASAIDRLVAVVDAFADEVEHPDLPGGCPVANTALESDDTHPDLCAHARRAMDSWHRLIGSIVKSGKERGELAHDVDPYELATLITATLEGALMLSRLMDNPDHMRRAAKHLRAHLSSLGKDG